MRAARRSPRSHGIRVSQAAASAIIDFIQRRSIFIILPPSPKRTDTPPVGAVSQQMTAEFSHAHDEEMVIVREIVAVARTILPVKGGLSQ
jgi:hypothetical protein